MSFEIIGIEDAFTYDFKTGVSSITLKPHFLTNTDWLQFDSLHEWQLEHEVEGEDVVKVDWIESPVKSIVIEGDKYLNYQYRDFLESKYKKIVIRDEATKETLYWVELEGQKKEYNPHGEFTVLTGWVYEGTTTEIEKLIATLYKEPVA